MRVPGVVKVRIRGCIPVSSKYSYVRDRQTRSHDIS